jgi:hypothetical protein
MQTLIKITGDCPSDLLAIQVLNEGFNALSQSPSFALSVMLPKGMK